MKVQLKHDVVAHCGPVARVAGLLPQAAAAPAKGAPAPPQADAFATRQQAASAVTLPAAAQVCLRPPCRPVPRRQAAPRQLGVLCRHAHAVAAAATEQAAPDRPKGKAKGKAKDASASHPPQSCTPSLSLADQVRRADQRPARHADDSPYKDTVNLPKTSFNMRANSAQREPELQKFWEANRVYQQLLETNKGVCVWSLFGTAAPGQERC